MSELDNAIALLEQAVMRLEAAASVPPASAPESFRVAEVADELTLRVDAALERIERLLAEGG